MAIATITTTVLPGSSTVTALANNLRDAFIALGFTTFDSYTVSGNEFRVMSIALSNAVKGTAYLQIGATSNGLITCQMYDSWNISNKTGTNGTTAVNYSIAAITTSAITLYLISHPECRTVIIEQGTTQSVFGLLRPKGSPPSWWNENNHLYAFTPKYNTNPSSTKFAASLTPFGNAADYDYFQSTKFQDGNSLNNNARSIFPLCILTPTVAGLINSFDDLVICSSNTLRPLDTLTVSLGEIYTYAWGNNSNSGIAIRTT